MPNEFRPSIRAAVFIGLLLSWAATAAADGYIVPKAVVVAPVPTWTGCYGGIDDGYKWGETRLKTPTPYHLNNTDSDSNHNFPFNAPPRNAPFPSPATGGTESLNNEGFVLGGQVGCNYQVIPGLVLGIETSGTGDWAKGTSNSIVTQSISQYQLGTVTTEVERTCQFRVGPHIGTTLNMGTGLSPLVYATGGYEGACYKASQAGHFFNPTVSNTNVSSSDFESGWFVGGGVDVPTPFLIPSTFVQIEYSHAETGGSGVQLAGTTATGKLENTTDEVRVGFKYLFPIPVSKVAF
jgi:outer membrane immunogenic protein